MEFEIVYWHWVVFGVLLMLSEIAITTFFILWFGIVGFTLLGETYTWTSLLGIGLVLSGSLLSLRY